MSTELLTRLHTHIKRTYFILKILKFCLIQLMFTLDIEISKKMYVFKRIRTGPIQS